MLSPNHMLSTTRSGSFGKLFLEVDVQPQPDQHLESARYSADRQAARGAY